MTTPPTSAITPLSSRRGWTVEEHERYLEAVERFPGAPWRVLAAYVGTRTTRQTMTHASKIALRQQRHARGLMKAGRKPNVTSDDDSATSTSSATAKAKVRRRRKCLRSKQRQDAEAMVAEAAAAAPQPMGQPLVVDPAIKGFVAMMRVAQSEDGQLSAMDLWDDLFHPEP